MSEQCSEVIAALAKVQEEMPTITFDAVNPHFRNRYATLAHILATVRPVLVKHGLSLTQVVTPGGALATVLLHKSGQWLRSDVPIISDKAGPQAFGSAMSYARRYGVCGLLAVAAEDDDDAEGATQRTLKPAAPEKPLPKPKKDAPPVTPAMQQDRKVAAASALKEPAWFDEKLGMSRDHAGKTWREMSQGGLGGGRHAFLEWAVKQEVRDEREDEFRARCKMVLGLYTAREAEKGDF